MADSISHLSLLSPNVHRLNTPEKRTQLLQELKRHKTQVACLQETHFRTDNIPRLTDTKYTTVYHATNKAAKSKGVAIFIAKRVRFAVTDVLADEDGRYLFIKGTLGNIPIMFANIYAPNVGQVAFISRICRCLHEFYHVALILGGDLNIPLHPFLDLSTGTSVLPYRALCRIRKDVQSLSLHDTWRTMHPNVNDYTHYSHACNKYSRLDYFFISQTDLPWISQTSIEPMYISHHNPVTLNISFG